MAGEATAGLTGASGAVEVATAAFAATDDTADETIAFVESAAAADRSKLAAATALAVGGGGAFATDSNGISNFAPH
jgi:hypothetical protein